MDDQESSSGLMIGMIAAGVLLAVMLLAGFFGVGLFFVARDELRPMAAPAAPIAVPVDEEKAPPPPVPPAPAPEK